MKTLTFWAVMYLIKIKKAKDDVAPTFKVNVYKISKRFLFILFENFLYDVKSDFNLKNISNIFLKIIISMNLHTCFISIRISSCLSCPLKNEKKGWKANENFHFYNRASRNLFILKLREM